MRVCGLKPIVQTALKILEFTPHAGVWIETAWTANLIALPSSHPMRVCGLKRFISLTMAGTQGSHPMRVCGLKPTTHRCVQSLVFTPHAGVWIETNA